MNDPLMNAYPASLYGLVNSLTNSGGLATDYGGNQVRLHKRIARPTGSTLLQGRPYTSAAATDVSKTWRKFDPQPNA